MPIFQSDGNDEMLRQTLEKLPVGAYVCDSDGLITYFNEASVKLWGREPKLNAPTDLYCGSFKLFTTDGNPIRHDECCMALALQQRKAFNGQEFLIERPDGSRWLTLAHANPLFNVRGELAGAVNVLINITDRRNGDLARSRLATIVESSEDAIISTDMNGIIESWNASAMRHFMYSPEQAVGQSITMLIPPDRFNEEEHILIRLQAGERIGHFDTVRTRSDGRPIPVSLTISPIKDTTDRIIGFSRILRDITDRKEIEEKNYQLMHQLKESDRCKNDFLAILAHELRNPLSPIRNAVKVLRLVGPDEPELNWCRDVIDRQTDHLTRIIDDLLDVSRITRNEMELHKERVELQSIVNMVIESCRYLIEEYEHNLTVSLPPEPIWIFADVVRISQVFVNLITNAAKYTERRGRISITVKQDGGDVMVSVKDSGIGVAAENLPKLFNMFYQADGKWERSDGGGLGIGLSLVHRLVRMHAGSVTAQSEGISKGSEFVVRLPFVAGSKMRTTEPTGKDKVLPISSCRILIVDDNKDVASSMAMLLKIIGNETQMAYDGIEAVEVAGTFRPDLVLLDIGLPKLNGYDACRRIRDKPWGKDMVIVALTGLGQDDDRQMSKEAGFNHHLVKPGHLNALMGLIAELKSSQV
ncbi:MAG: PAS domain S-box protein [Planctomycetota bacterium]|nr:PAS domain S-box protein [Planctomycetota bacterium]